MPCTQHGHLTFSSFVLKILLCRKAQHKFTYATKFYILFTWLCLPYENILIPATSYCNLKQYYRVTNLRPV